MIYHFITLTIHVYNTEQKMFYFRAVVLFARWKWLCQERL